MPDHIVPDDDGKGFTYIFKGGDIEFVDPIEYLAETTIKSRTILHLKILQLKGSTLPADDLRKKAIEKAHEDWNDHYNELINAEIPPNLFVLLGAESKKEQIRLLKGMQLTPETLFSFIFKAYTSFGYKYSQYSAEHFPKSINRASLPRMATLNRETGEIKKTGVTTLTDGQIKQAIEQRKVISTKFIDNGSDWHAFFITYRSIGGEESWKNGQPHYHYISNKFGITREDAVRQFKSDSYPTTSVHIKLLDYGNQPNKS